MPVRGDGHRDRAQPLGELGVGDEARDDRAPPELRCGAGDLVGQVLVAG